MKVTIKPKENQKFLDSVTILKYLQGTDDKIDTLIMCKPIKLITTDFNLHEALGTIPKDKFKLNKLVKFLETVKVVSYENVHHKPKPVLTDARVLQLASEVKNG